MSTSRLSRSRLESLPRELQEIILEALDVEPSSLTTFGRRPEGTLHQGKRDAALKALSACSSSLHYIGLPHLYKHAVVRVEAIASFLHFISSHHLADVVTSLVILINETSFTAGFQEATSAPILWRLLHELPSLSSVTVSCPPTSFPHLSYCATHDGDAWTFNMPFHYLRLELEPKSVGRRNTMERPFMIFKALPWEGFSVNEGSFLRAYTQYEYFLRRPPSILTGRTINSRLQLPRAFLKKLKYFNYTAIFPFYNHVSAVLSFIETTMPELHALTISLSPHPDQYDAINALETRESSGKIDFHDVWMEFETSYEVVAYHVRQLAWKAKLRVFKSVDWTFGGEPRRITEERIASRLERRGRTVIYHQSADGTAIQDEMAPHSWQPQGDGTWIFKSAEALEPSEVEVMRVER